MSTLRTLINLLTEPAPKGRAQGPDISHWNVPRTAGKPVVAFNPHTATEQIDFVFQKVTEGVSWIDPMIDENWQGVKDVPIRFAYHYQRAAQSWIQQVNHFYRTAERYNFHGYVIDLEKTYNWDGAGPITRDTFFQDTRRMIEQLWNITSKPVILYTNKDVYQNHLRPAIYRVYRDEGLEWLENNPRLLFWYAQYWTAWSVNKEPALPPTRTAWDFWQVTEAGKGTDWGVQSGNVDVNVYNGTPAQLAARLHLAPTPDPEPEDPPVIITPAEPETLPDVWTGKIISWTRMTIRKYPEVGTETDSGHRMYLNEGVCGRLWIGNGYLWMKLDMPGKPVHGLWIAVRRHPQGDRFVKLDTRVTTPLPDGLELVRVVWDDENPDWSLKCRTQDPGFVGPKSPPAVNRFYPKGREDGGDYRVNLAKPYDWKNGIISLNGGGSEGVRRWQYLTGPGRAQYNSTGWPRQAHLAMSGNKLRGKFIGEWFEFETLKQNDLTRAQTMTIETHPHLVHRFTCVGWQFGKTKHIESTNTARGQVYYFLVTEEGKAYIPRRHVKRL